MKLLIVLLLCLVASNLVLAKKHHRKHKQVQEDVEEAIDGQEEEEDEEDVRGGYDNDVKDPCEKKRCGEGRECDLNEHGKPICVCIKSCLPNNEPRTQVCSTHNVTFESDCELLRQRCLCQKKQEGCQDPKYRHAKLDYFGPCMELQECKDDEMEEFPKRMRQWLFLVMEELAERRDLNEKARQMAEEARTHSKRWVLPVIWKFCDLDITHDRVVNAHELVPISAPLKALEHCTGPFLEKCDTDDSEDISLEEWGTCLGLDPEEIEDKCDALNED